MSDENKQPQPSLSRPKDNSLESYKAWIKEITLSLNPQAEMTLTDKEYEDGWKRFWAKAESG